MERVNLTRTYLETLSSADLNDLAEDYGIDIPEDLTRRFVIAELLEAAADERNREPNLRETGAAQNSCADAEKAELPVSYNENKITAVLRNPAWCYVYWDIKKTDYAAAVKDGSFAGFILRIAYYRDSFDESAFDTFDISVEKDDREQYVFLSTYAQGIQVSLIAEFSDRKPFQLAQSVYVRLPRKQPDVGPLSLHRSFSPILTLSGLPELIRFQYNEHRQSFSSDV